MKRTDRASPAPYGTASFAPREADRPCLAGAVLRVAARGWADEQVASQNRHYVNSEVCPRQDVQPLGRSGLRFGFRFAEPLARHCTRACPAVRRAVRVGLAALNARGSSADFTRQEAREAIRARLFGGAARRAGAAVTGPALHAVRAVIRGRAVLPVAASAADEQDRDQRCAHDPDDIANRCRLHPGMRPCSGPVPRSCGSCWRSC